MLTKLSVYGKRLLLKNKPFETNYTKWRKMITKEIELLLNIAIVWLVKVIYNQNSSTQFVCEKCSLHMENPHKKLSR